MFISKFKLLLNSSFGNINKYLYTNKSYKKTNLQNQSQIKQIIVDINDDEKEIDKETNENNVDPKNESDEEEDKSENSSISKASSIKCSGVFKAITREQWERLLNNGHVNVPVGAHRPRYNALQRYFIF